MFMPKTIESDVVVIGAGISAAMVAEKLTEQTDAKVVVIEAGNKIFNLDERFERRERFLRYRENPWPGDHIRGQTARGIHRARWRWEASRSTGAAPRRGTHPKISAYTRSTA